MILGFGYELQWGRGGHRGMSGAGSQMQTEENLPVPAWGQYVNPVYPAITSW